MTERRPEGMPLLLDTNAVIRIAEDLDMSAQSSREIDRAFAEGRDIYVSPISAWEIGMLVAKGRLHAAIRPDRWFRRFMDAPGLSLADMTPDLLIESSFLPGEAPRDPADRIIAATAREFGYRLVTRDEELLAYGRGGHIETLAC